MAKTADRFVDPGMGAGPDMVAFIETWNECFAHPFSWSYTGEGLHTKAVRLFCRLIAIQSER